MLNSLKNLFSQDKINLTPEKRFIDISLEKNPNLYKGHEDAIEFLKEIDDSEVDYPDHKVKFHIYTEIRSDKELMAVKSFLATQNLDKTELIIWSDYSIEDNELIKPYKEYITLKVYDPIEEAKSTPLENHKILRAEDELYYLKSDIARILLLYKYGGVWYDMDVILLRDFKAILDQEYMYQWGGITDFAKEGACATVLAGKKNSIFILTLLNKLKKMRVKPNSVCFGKKMFAKCI